jgi:hypothetical protein
MRALRFTEFGTPAAALAATRVPLPAALSPLESRPPEREAEQATRTETQKRRAADPRLPERS